MKEQNQVGPKITALRQIKNVSIQELAERCGFPVKMMEKIEKGDSIPSLGHLIKVARVLGVRRLEPERAGRKSSGRMSFLDCDNQEIA